MDESRESLKQSKESAVTDQSQLSEWLDCIGNTTLQLGPVSNKLVLAQNELARYQPDLFP